MKNRPRPEIETKTVTMIPVMPRADSKILTSTAKTVAPASFSPLVSKSSSNPKVSLTSLPVARHARTLRRSVSMAAEEDVVVEIAAVKITSFPENPSQFSVLLP